MIPSITLTKQTKIKYFVSWLFVFQSGRQGKVNTHEHLALTTTAKKAAPSWLSNTTLPSKGRACVCAALIPHLQTEGQSQRNGEPRLKYMSVRQEKEPRSRSCGERDTDRHRGKLIRWGPWKAFVLWTRRVSEAALGRWFKATNSKSIFYSLSEQTHGDTRTWTPKRAHTQLRHILLSATYAFWRK